MLYVGHGDNHSRSIPTLVKDVSGIGSVNCGSSFTVIISQDATTAWSFGAGDNGMNTPLLKLHVVRIALLVI